MAAGTAIPVASSTGGAVVAGQGSTRAEHHRRRHLNAVHLHLLVVHVPILFAPLGLAFMAIAYLKRRSIVAGRGSPEVASTAAAAEAENGDVGGAAGEAGATAGEAGRTTGDAGGAIAELSRAPTATHLEYIAHWLVIVSAATAGVAFFSGGPTLELMAEELAELRDVAELHGLVGRGAFILLVLLSAGSVQVVVRLGGRTAPAWLTWFFSTAAPDETEAPRRSEPPPAWLRATMAAGLALACGLLAWSGYLGGSLRHPGIG